jgi:glycosyltransferase involved in cell wall biosynthesis
VNKIILKDSIVIIDWNTSGHHLTYLKEYILAFHNEDIPIVVLSPERPSFNSSLKSVEWRPIPKISWIKKHQLLGIGITRWRYARRIKYTMRDAERTLGVKCRKAFFGCFYENQSKITSQIITTLALPASGLYLQANLFHSNKHLSNCKLRYKVERLFKHPLLSTIFMLDEGMIPEVIAWCNKNVVHLPDVSDYSYDGNDMLVRQLKLIPKKRPILGLLGHLRPSKGLSEMITFAKSVPDLDATFLIAGSCDWNDFPLAEAEFIKRAVLEDSRIIFYPWRIMNESSYNALIQITDVLWAFYRDTPHSSNTLVKAAYFRRPVVVAEGHLMAQMTRDYTLGVVVPENDPLALREALLPMLEKPDEWIKIHSKRYAEFINHNSSDIFRERLKYHFNSK